MFLAADSDTAPSEAVGLVFQLRQISHSDVNFAGLRPMRPFGTSNLDVPEARRGASARGPAAAPPLVGNRI